VAVLKSITQLRRVGNEKRKRFAEKEGGIWARDPFYGKGTEKGNTYLGGRDVRTEMGAVVTRSAGNRDSNSIYWVQREEPIGFLQRGDWRVLANSNQLRRETCGSPDARRN